MSGPDQFRYYLRGAEVTPQEFAYNLWKEATAPPLCAPTSPATMTEWERARALHAAWEYGWASRLFARLAEASAGRLGVDSPRAREDRRFRDELEGAAREIETRMAAPRRQATDVEMSPWIAA